MERHRERSGAEKERFNEQYPDLMNKGYFTDVDDEKNILYLSDSDTAH